MTELELLELIREASGGWLVDDHIYTDDDECVKPGHVVVRLETDGLDLTDLLARLQ